MDRRSFLSAAVATGVASLSGCTGDGGDGASDERVSEWLSDARGYESTVDRTDAREVRVMVGAGDGFSFDPAGLRVAPLTTVVWEWTGQGDQHNVVNERDRFHSEFAGSEGYTYRHEFPDSGGFRYYCKPHRSVGMKGAVVVE